jgi:hypothetical protein
MAKTFKLEIKTSADEMLKKAKDEAAKSGASLDGDASSGRFSGSGVAGTYRVVGDSVEITIEKKPLVVPMALVESKVREFFS